VMVTSTIRRRSAAIVLVCLLGIILFLTLCSAEQHHDVLVSARVSSRSSSASRTSPAETIEVRPSGASFENDDNRQQLLLIKDQEEARRTFVFVCLLAASAGWGDVRSHRTYGCFINMCTGNTIRGTMAVVEGQWRNSILSFTVVAGYCAGVSLARSVKHAVENHKANKPTIKTSPNAKLAQTILLPLVSKSNTCLAIVPLMIGLFVISDCVMARTTKLFASALPQAIAYGLIHETASQISGGTVLFAVTGHWASISRLTTDKICTRQSQPAKLSLNASMVASFIAGIVVSVLFLDRIVPLLPPFSYPVNTLTGLGYGLLFCWYGRCGR